MFPVKRRRGFIDHESFLKSLCVTLDNLDELALKGEIVLDADPSGFTPDFVKMLEGIELQK